MSSFIHILIHYSTGILSRVPIFGSLLSHDTVRSSKDVRIIGGGVVPWTLIRVEIRARDREIGARPQG